MAMPTKNYYLLLMEDLIAVAKQTQQFGLSEREWAIFENFIDEAIEKQFATIPIDKVEDNYWGGYVGKCPYCGRTVIDEDDYCNNCGQKLEWGLYGRDK